MSNRKKIWLACGYEQCSRVFTSKGLLDRHFSTHQTYTRKVVNSDRKFKCELCPASFDYTNNLIAHIYSHTAEKPFVCKYQDCNQKFAQQASLSRHMKALHLKPNSFKCTRCTKTFNYKGSLILHLRMHTGEKPYACEYCNYKCNNRRSLSLHALRWHKGEKDKKHNESYPKSKNIVLSEKLMVKLTPLSKTEISKLMSVGTNSVSVSQEKLKNVQIHTKKQVFPCKKCSKTFTSYHQLGGHVKSHRNWKIEQGNSKGQKPVSSNPLKPKLEEPEVAKPKRKSDAPLKPKSKLEEPEAAKPKRKSDAPLKPKSKLEEPTKPKLKGNGSGKPKSKWEESTTKPFPCPRCEMSYSYQSYLDLHMMSHRNTETPMQIEDNDILPVEEDFCQISEDDLQETGSEDFDFESRVSDIDSTDSTPDMCDSSILTKELYWPTDCNGTENSEIIVIKPEQTQFKEVEDVCINNSSIDPKPTSLEENPIVNNSGNAIAEQLTLPVEENILNNEPDSDMNGENMFLKKNEKVLGSCSNTMVTNPETIIARAKEDSNLWNGVKEDLNVSEVKEDLNLKNEVKEDLFTIIDENNDFHKAIVSINIDTDDLTCPECGKKSRDQYLLYRHVQTQHNKGTEIIPNSRGIKRKKTSYEKNGLFTDRLPINALNTTTMKTGIEKERNSAIDEINEPKRMKFIEKIPGVLKKNGEDLHNNSSMQKELPMTNQPVNNKTKLDKTTRKPLYTCSCKKKFVREKNLYKHLAQKIDSVPLHFQIHVFPKQSPIKMKNKGEIPSAEIENNELEDSQNVETLSTSATFSCGLCKKVYSTYDILLSHIKLIHRKGEKAIDFIINRLVRRPDKIKSFRCPFCPTTFSRYGNLMRHTKKIHGTPEKKDCSANLHKKTNDITEEGEITSLETRELPPNEENLIFAKKSELDFINSPQTTEIISSGSEDNISGVGDTNYEDISSKPSPGDNTEDCEQLTNAIPLKSNFLQANFSGINSLETKPLPSLRKNRNLCSRCPKVFVSTHHLDVHMRLKHKKDKIIANGELQTTHNEMVKKKTSPKSKSSKTFICPHYQCNRKFSSQIPLNYHMLIHSDVEAMKASKEIKESNEFTTEINSTCTICGQTFANSFSLDRHMKNKLIHLPGYRHRKNTKKYVTTMTITKSQRTPQLKKLADPGDTSKLEKLAVRTGTSQLKKLADRNGTSKRKKLAVRNGPSKLKRLAVPSGTSAKNKTALSHCISKLKKLADELCIPCSVYLERSLIQAVPLG